MSAPSITVDVALEDLLARDDHAWDAYAQACHDPLATDEQRHELFQAALRSMTAVFNHQRHR